jgi:hypothetical protein
MKKMCFRICMGLVLTVILILFTGVVYADEITDSINEALTHYKSNDYSAAAESLTYALQLIGQKKGGQLQELLPKPLSGWTADDASSEVANAAMFGGGINAERQYRKDPPEGSDQETSYVTVKFTTDSPMMQGMMMMFNNPMFATSDGGKLEKIKGEKAIVKFSNENKSGSINIMVAGKTLVSIEGSAIKLDVLKSYAEAIDYKKIATLQ